MIYANLQLTSAELELFMDLLAGMGSALPASADAEAPSVVRSAYRLAANVRSDLYTRLTDALDALRAARAEERKQASEHLPF